MVNKIWAFFIIVGIVFSFFSGGVQLINNEILECTKTTLDMIFRIFPVMSLWLGIMQIAQTSGLISKFSKLISPLLKIIFPEIPKNHESLSYISSSMAANMLGLGNAATPFGLKAMQSMQDLNKSDVASRSMITFLVINTCGLTIIPTTVISLRDLYNSNDPTSIVFPCIFVTFTAFFIGLLLDRFFSKFYVNDKRNK